MHHGVLREAKAIRFKFIEEHQNKVPIQWLCQIMNVSARGWPSTHEAVKVAGF